jgi:hypothetical protein
LPIVSSCENKVSINPIIQSKTPSIVTPTRDNIYYIHINDWMSDLLIDDVWADGWM